MAQRFLLPCDCGNLNEVSTTQAGATLICPCGRPNHVPSLAGLRRLTPVSTEKSAPRPGKPFWSKFAIGLTIGVVALLGVAILGGLIFWNQHHYAAAQQAMERRDFDQAESHLQQRITLGLGGLQGELLGVQTARRSGNTEAAAKRLERCQKRFGADPSVVLEQRLLAMQQGDLQEASQLLASHAAQPDSPEAVLVLEAYIRGSLWQLANAYNQNDTFEGSPAAKQIVETKRAIEQWLRLRPQQADQVLGLVWRFQTHLFSHSPAAARVDINRALELDPDHRYARIMLATYLGHEYLDESAAQWQQLHEAYPDDVNITLNLAAVRRRLGQLDDAKTLFDQVLASDPYNVPALIDRGRVAMDMEDLAGAEEWFRSACREDPASVEANLALSRCLRATGKVEEADRLQKKVDELRDERIREREAALSSTLP
jgi:tetratricopeptide (TPR) repeat protein